MSKDEHTASGNETISPSEILYSDLEGFLRAGGTFGYEEWSELPEDIKACLIVAGEKLRIENAVMAAQAGQGTPGIARLVAPMDGGDMLVRYGLEKVVNEYLASRKAD